MSSMAHLIRLGIWLFLNFLRHIIFPYILYNSAVSFLLSFFQVLFTNTRMNVFVLYAVRLHVCQQADDVDAKL